MENVALTHQEFWQDKTVLVTGHTGFKGSWLALWLQHLGARVVGYSLEPPTEPSLFRSAGIDDGMVSIIGDINDEKKFQDAIRIHRPQLIFHLAAQSLVRHSYQYPKETYVTNVIGTLNLLEAVRSVDEVRVCQIITSDKCYENREWEYAYRENDRLGGYDPYSNSKACAELLVAAYRRSFFSQTKVSIATARAGNVIGGGDWAVDRIVPDCMRALYSEQKITIRNPHAVRPWQFVLEPLSGYLWLARYQWEDAQRFSGGWNFGPADQHSLKVSDLADHIIALWGKGSWQAAPNVDSPHEANTLRLDITRANNLLEWRPVYNVKQALQETASWYKYAKAEVDKNKIKDFCIKQIIEYQNAARNAEIKWALNTCRHR